MKKIIVLVLFFLITMSQVFSQRNLSVKVANNFIEQFPNPDSICWEKNGNHFSWQAI